MNEIPVETAPANSARVATLGRLCEFSMEERYALLIRHDREGFESALRVLGDAAANMDVPRLAWALAFNLSGFPIRSANVDGRSGGGERDGWFSEVEWPTVWSLLVRPLARDDSGNSGTLLSELALSVACEQREDWQIPSARPLDLAAANRAFDRIYARDRLKVLAVCGRYADAAGDSEAIALEAWSIVFCKYWSSDASRRFLGLSRISTLVCQVARNLAIDSFRRRARLVSSDEPGTEDKFPASTRSFGGQSDPSARVEQSELNTRLRECMGRLAAKARIVAEMVWLRKIPANRAAQILKVSEPAISQHLKRSREAVGVCLKDHGFRLPS